MFRELIKPRPVANKIVTKQEAYCNNCFAVFSPLSPIEQRVRAAISRQRFPIRGGRAARETLPPGVKTTENLPAGPEEAAIPPALLVGGVFGPLEIPFVFPTLAQLVQERAILRRPEPIDRFRVGRHNGALGIILAVETGIDAGIPRQ